MSLLIFEVRSPRSTSKGLRINAVDGIILLHPINRNRMSEASVALGTLRKAFSKVLDTDLESRYPFFRVALATTLWVTEVTGGAATKAAIEKERAKQIRRECDLQDNWWRLLEVQGAMFRRHDNDLYESAKDIVLSVIKVTPNCRYQRTELTLIRPKCPSKRQCIYEIN